MLPTSRQASGTQWLTERTCFHKKGKRERHPTEHQGQHPHFGLQKERKMMGEIKGCSCVGRTFPQTSKLRFLRTQPSRRACPHPHSIALFCASPQNPENSDWPVEGTGGRSWGTGGRFSGIVLPLRAIPPQREQAVDPPSVRLRSSCVRGASREPQTSAGQAVVAGPSGRGG